MDPIVAILFLILFFSVVILFSRLLVPLMIVFVLYWVIKSFIDYFKKPKPTNDYRRPNDQTTYSQSQQTRTRSTTSNPDVFDAEFETRELPDEHQ